MSVRSDNLVGDIPADSPRCQHGTRLDRWCAECVALMSDPLYVGSDAVHVGGCNPECDPATGMHSLVVDAGRPWLGLALLLLAALAGYALGKLA